MLERFNEFEKERKEKEKVIEDLQEKLYVLSSKVEKMENRIGKQEWNLRWNCLLIYGS